MGSNVHEPRSEGNLLNDFIWLACHPNFEEHQAGSGRRPITCEEADEAWYLQHQIVPNRKTQPAPYLMIGETERRRPITVVLFGTGAPDTWLAYTAWDTKDSHL